MRTTTLVTVVVLAACNRSGSHSGPDLTGAWEALRTELSMTTQVVGYPPSTLTSATPRMNTGASIRIADGATARPRVTLRIGTSTDCQGEAVRSGSEGSERLTIAQPHCCDGGCGPDRCELAVVGGPLVLEQDGSGWSYRFELRRPEQPGACERESFQRGSFASTGSDWGPRRQ